MNQAASRSLLPETASTSGKDAVIDLGRVLSILRRGWWIIAASGLVCALVAAVVVLRIEPTYYARSQILMGQDDRTGSPLGALLQDLQIDDDVIAGEIAIIQSGELLAKVTERLNLARRPEFNAALRPPEPPPPLPMRLADQAVDYLKTLMGIPVAPEPSGTADPSQPPDPISVAARVGKDSLGDQADLVAELAANLKVRQVGSTNLVDVQYVSTDRMLAAAIPNALADVYLENQLDRKFNALSRVTSGLQSRLDDMRSRLESSERAVIDYRNGNLAEGYGGIELLSQQIGDLSRRASQAAAEHAELSSDLVGIDSLIAQEGLLSATGLFQSELLNRLQSEVVDLRQRRDRLVQRFGSDTAQSVGTTEEINRLEAIIAQETRRLRNEHAQRTDLAEARVNALQTELHKLEARAIEQAERQIRLTQLERQYEAEQAVYTSFLDMFTQTSEAQGLQERDAQIIAYADPPPAPIAPNKKLSVALGGIGGALAGMGLVLLRSFMDSAVRSTAQIARMTRGTVLSQPRVSRFLGLRANPLVVAERDPLGQLSESIRSLRSHLLLSAPKDRGAIISVVSSLTNGGKTTTSILLARSLAQMGIDCVLVEADLRRPSFVKALKLSQGADLVDVLTGKMPIEQALRTDEVSGAKILTARRGLRDPAGVLLSDAMNNLLLDLRKSHRMVIVDNSPLAPVSDAAPIIRISDETLFLVPYGMSAGDVESGIADVSKFAPKHLLTVMSMTPRSAQKNYGYSYKPY